MDNYKIPKKLHYIWFGDNPKSELIMRCIDSWHRFLPDYEIIEWNETNYDINKCDYARKAYESKKWAFVSDYVRFDVLNEYGGIYVDTDVEFLKPIPEELLRHKAFTGYESSGNIAPGLIYGAIPGFSINREILDVYENIHFTCDEKPVFKTVNSVVKEVLEKHTSLRKDEFQMVNGLAIYPSNFFCGYDLDVGEYDIRSETISVHHYAGSWTSPGTKKKIQNFIKKVLGVPGYKKLLVIKRRLLGASK